MGAHVGETRVAALGKTLRECSSEYSAGVALNELSVCHSRLPREQPPAVVAGERLVVLVEIGHFGESGGQPVYAGSAQARGDRLLDLAEAAGES